MFCWFFFFFFFQAEDGIRDFCLSRGLGDVYKRQEEIKALGEENFFHADYEATLADTYGSDYEDTLVVEGGETK